MKYFTVNELCKSSTATKKGIANVPSSEERANLEALIANVLDPLREAWGKPIVVNSGFRCERLNKAVGGAAGSQHKTGEAADIEAVTRDPADNRRLFELVRKLGLPFDQMINEFGYDWVHISFSRSRRRGQVLEAKKSGGKTVYVSMK